MTCLTSIISWLRKEAIAISTQCQPRTSGAHRDEKLKIALRLQFGLICQVTSSANSFNRTEFSTDWTCWIVFLTFCWVWTLESEDRRDNLNPKPSTKPVEELSALLALWACPTKRFKQRSYSTAWSNSIPPQTTASSLVRSCIKTLKPLVFNWTLPGKALHSLTAFAFYKWLRNWCWIKSIERKNSLKSKLLLASTSWWTNMTFFLKRLKIPRGVSLRPHQNSAFPLTRSYLWHGE